MVIFSGFVCILSGKELDGTSTVLAGAASGFGRMPTTTMPLLPPEAAGSLQSTTNTLDFLHRHARPPQEGCFNRSRWYDFVTNRVEKKLPPTNSCEDRENNYSNYVTINFG
jgi:hypothetical protein